MSYGGVRYNAPKYNALLCELFFGENIVPLIETFPPTHSPPSVAEQVIIWITFYAV